MFVSGHSSYALLAGVLFVRGAGLGAAVQPSVAAAYQRLDSAQVPRATAALNTLRQVGGSIGTALLVVILQHEATAVLSSRGMPAGGLLTPLARAERVRISEPVATAFAHTFLWALVLALVTTIPAAMLIYAGRGGRRREYASRSSAKEPELSR